MRQFSIKNDRAAELLDKATSLTEQAEAEAVIDYIRVKIHSHLKPECRGKVPSKEVIEAKLGMP